MARRAEAASQIQTRNRGPSGRREPFNFAGIADPGAVDPLDAAAAAEAAEQAELAARLPVVVIPTPLRPASFTEQMEAARLVTLASGLADLPWPAHILGSDGPWPPPGYVANDNGTETEFLACNHGDMIESCPLCHNEQLGPSTVCPNCKRSSVDYLILRIKPAPKPVGPTKYHAPARGGRSYRGT
jgi:hypothetical protein